MLQFGHLEQFPPHASIGYHFTAMVWDRPETNMAGSDLYGREPCLAQTPVHVCPDYCKLNLRVEGVGTIELKL